MKYSEFRDAIQQHLLKHPEGRTWKALQAELSLPYAQACPEWVRRLEVDIGLSRKEKKGAALIWKCDLAAQTASVRRPESHSSTRST